MKIHNSLILSISVLALSACSQVTPGNVGVQVTSWGPGAGVDTQPKPVGIYFTGINSSIHEYPISTQTYVWSNSQHEGRNWN